MTRILVSFPILLACLPFHSLALAAAYEPPSQWSELGTVEEWAALDSHFHRVAGVEGATDLKVYRFEQQSIYDTTKKRRTALPRLELQEFLALDEQDRTQRRDEAGGQLKYVVEFRHRIASRVSDVQMDYVGGWGTRPSDHRAVGDVLGRLQEAVGLDPSNVYAWHLLAWFSADCGDVWRALDALDGAEAALAILPPGALTEVRRRALLDRAWLLRDLGMYEQALERVDAAQKLQPADRETVLIRGLIAARYGDYRTATQLANQLDSTPVPFFLYDFDQHSQAQLRPAILDPMAWPTRDSGYLKAWILALMWLHEGQADLAWKAFPEFSLDRHYVNGRRFLNEAAAIYEATGRPSLAAQYWAAATRYVPFLPYLVYTQSGTNLESFTGRRGAVPFVLAYDTNLIAGSRLAHGVSLLGSALAGEEPAHRADLAQRAVLELEVCGRTDWDPAAAQLALGYAHALLGDPEATLAAAEAALADLDPQRDRERWNRADQLRKLALQGAPELRDGAGGDLPATAFETPEQTEARLRTLFGENPDDRAARRDLARWLIRHGRTDEGAGLLEALLPPQGEPETGDWLVALELDRQLNDSARARQMLQALLEGRAANWPDPDLWATVGILCQEHGVERAEAALRYALELNPDNRGLREHLEAAAD